MSKLLEKLEGTEFERRFRLFKDKIIDVLPDNRIYFPTFTNHDLTHIYGVEKIVDSILSKEVLEKFNNEEIFCLLCAIYLHDIGMNPNNEEKDEINNGNILAEKQNIKRNVHNLLSEQYIMDNAKQLGFKSGEDIAISNIAKGHRQINLKSLKPIFIIDVEINVPLLASILRLADECHITSDRLIPLSSKIIDNDIYNQHFKKFELFVGYKFDKDNGEIIFYSKANCENDLKIINDSIKKIQSELNNVSEIFLMNNINLHTVKYILSEYNLLIQNRIILCLANEKSVNSLINNYVSCDLINENLDILIGKNIIDENISIKNDLNTFKYIVNLFFELQEEYNNFIKSKYCQSMIKNLFLELKLYYNADFDLIQSNRRINLLVNSPTSIYLSLFLPEIINNKKFNISSHQGGDVILDYIISLGYLYDLHYYGETNIKDTKENFFEILKENESKIKLLINFYEKLEINK